MPSPAGGPAGGEGATTDAAIAARTVRHRVLDAVGEAASPESITTSWDYGFRALGRSPPSGRAARGVGGPSPGMTPIEFRVVYYFLPCSCRMFSSSMPRTASAGSPAGFLPI